MAAPPHLIIQISSKYLRAASATHAVTPITLLLLSPQYTIAWLPRMAVPIYNYYCSPLLGCLPCAFPFSSFPPYRQLHLLSPNSLHSSSSSLYHLKNQSITSATITVFPLSRRRRRALTMDCQATPEQKPISQDRMLVFVPPHPLIKHWLSVVRNEDTPTPIFKSAMAELGRLLMYEASRDWLPMISGEIQSPLGVATVEFIDPREPVAVVPILRAGLALAEHASSILPANKTYHLGISRNEETLQPTVYLNKLPDRFPEGSRVFVVDPMVGTGGTIVAALNLIKERGVDNKQIKVVAAVAAPPALQKLSEKFPGLHVYAGNIDPALNDKGFIIPGLGDAGDRSFGT
ncbi:uracil phosphoribosyltransferase [Coffea arabica]|uniref:uracil phosphoribosyltransferase n=1 Tax=Coffea arabica TaxID=13443 RepID=A0A6P6SZ25_COFAR|nr:uracil phosphoribosyltransferase-like isoform X3 [Coffea arabica]